MPNGQPRVVRRRTSTEADAPVRKRSRPGGGGGGGANSEQPEDQTQPPGFIKNITLKNFMCHEHLTLDLNERLNFIKGQNGSGKSAVLTAVMVGLGARTSTTDRGTSIAKLIRTDQRSAVVSVTLNNSGHYAILPEKFGNSFTVERTIRDGGSSAYRISNEKGKLGPMKKGDLVSILDGLNIQVDNPLVILTQETSKNFLRGDDPKKKYNLFLDATRLSHIERWHEKTRKSQMSTKNALEVKEQSLEARKKQAKEYEREVNFHKNRDNVKEKIKMLELNLLWAKVMEEEKALEAAKAGQKKKEEEMKAIVTRTENREQKLQEKRELKQKKERLDQERTEAAGRVNQLKKKLRDELEVQQRAAAVRIKQAETRFDDQVRDRENLKTEIARRRNEAQPDLETEAQRRQQAMAELEGELNELDAAEKTRAGHLQNVSGTLQRQKDELKQGEDERRELDNKIKELDMQVRRCQVNQANARAVFGSWVEHVDRAIETSWQQRKFRKKPIGPIGAYVRVRADCEEWKPLVETCLSGVLRAYLVDDQSDLRVMSAILKEHTHNERNKPRVIASKFLSEIHDVSRLGIDTSSGEHVSVWSVLEIDNPVVANAVIDQARVEAVLLLRTEEEAHSKLAFRERVPHGCSQALTMAGNRYFPDPSYRTYPINVPRQARFLQVSMQEVISDLSRQLQEKRDDAQETVGRLDPARTALKESQRREEEARRQLEETRRQKQTVRRRLRELQDQQEPEPSNLQALALKGKLNGPGAGRPKAEKWEEARALAASLGLIGGKAAVSFLKKNVVANQLRLTRGRRDAMYKTGNGYLPPLDELDQLVLDFGGRSDNHIVPGALNSLMMEPIDIGLLLSASGEEDGEYVEPARPAAADPAPDCPVLEFSDGISCSSSFVHTSEPATCSPAVAKSHEEKLAQFMVERQEIIARRQILLAAPPEALTAEELEEVFLVRRARQQMQL